MGCPSRAAASRFSPQPHSRTAANAEAKIPASGRDTPSLPSRLVRRQILVPLPKHLERAPEALLGVLFVKRFVDVRGVEGVDGRRESLNLTLARLNRAREGDFEAVEDAQRALQGLLSYLIVGRGHARRSL